MVAAAKPTTERITESFSRSSKVDRAGGVIRDVKLIGFKSKNNRTYPPNVLKNSVSVYEGAKVNLDHPERDAAQPRKYSERFGVIRSARFVEGQGVFGDFHFNPKHPLAEQVLWDAENNPEAMGFSHNAVVRSVRSRDGMDVAESILSVRSMDLVADPATTSSLFESEDYSMDPNAPAETASAADPLEVMIDSFAAKIAEIAKSDTDPKAKMQQIKDMISKQEKLKSMFADPAKEDPAPADAASQEQVDLRKQLAETKAKLEQFETKEREAVKLKSIETALVTEGLDPKNPRHCSELFNKQLLTTESETDRLALIKDRAALVGVSRRTESVTPSYKPQTSDSLEQLDAKAFASRLLSH